MKTHKSVLIAQLQLDAGAIGLTVATPHEAEVMSTVCSDLLLAYPPVGASKIARLAALPGHVEMRVGLDAAAVLKPLAEVAQQVGRVFGILVEFDAGLGRVGVTDPGEALRLAEIASELDGVRFDGLMFYPGHIRVPRAEQAGLLAELSDRVGTFLGVLSDGGLEARVVSGGSTPTLWDSHRIEGLTEVRPGTCIYNDRDIARMGACEPAEVAYSVLASVVSVAVPGQAVVDAGSKALSKESFRSPGAGFGALLNRPEVTVKALSEEHGVLDLGRTEWRPSIGDRVRIVPNHVCVSVNLQDRLWGTDGEDVMPIELEGRGRAPYHPESPGA